MVEREEASRFAARERLINPWSIKTAIELSFRQRIEGSMFRLPGLVKYGVAQGEVIIQARQFIADVRENYGQDINSLTREVFPAFTSLLAERPVSEIPRRKVFDKHRLNLIAARIMARVGVDTKHIALELGNDWATVNHWTRDIKEDLQKVKRESVRQLVKRGIPLYKVVRMLKVGYPRVIIWCQDILNQLKERRRATLHRERELATQGFWPSYIAKESGVNRSTVLKHVKGCWPGRRVEIKQERQNREERIRAAIEEERQKGVGVTKSSLAKELGVKRDTIAKDLSRLGIILNKV